VFSFRDQGARWGLVALDQKVSRGPLLSEVDDALGRRSVGPAPAALGAPSAAVGLPLAGGAPGPTTPPTDSSGNTIPPSPGPNRNTTTTTSPVGAITVPPIIGGPQPPGSPTTTVAPGPVRGLVQGVGNVVGGLLGGLLNPRG